MDHDFEARLAWSRGRAEQTDQDTIRRLMPGCMSVVPASVALDRQGVDYVATLRRGAEVMIDLKVRDAGVSRWWQTEEPELTLEYWSHCPTPLQPGRVGWTLDERKITDYVLYLFSSFDTDEAFLLPFQLLRLAFRHEADAWRRQYGAKRCSSNGGAWETESIFVPARVVIAAVSAEMRRRT